VRVGSRLISGRAGLRGACPWCRKREQPSGQRQPVQAPLAEQPGDYALRYLSGRASGTLLAAGVVVISPGGDLPARPTGDRTGPGGGLVCVHGLGARDAGDEAGRRLAAVQLVRLRAAGQAAVAAAFGVDPVTVWRWDQAFSGRGGRADPGPEGAEAAVQADRRCGGAGHRAGRGRPCPAGDRAGGRGVGVQRPRRAGPGRVPSGRPPRRGG
jgi:hypothetical protein